SNIQCPKSNVRFNNQCLPTSEIRNLRFEISDLRAEIRTLDVGRWTLDFGQDVLPVISPARLHYAQSRNIQSIKFIDDHLPVGRLDVYRKNVEAILIQLAQISF